MFCINCHNKNTKVINSRASKKSPEIWRRRHCPECSHTFTTRENPDLVELPIVTSGANKSNFSLLRLTLSIAKSLEPSDDRADDAYWLANTVYQKLPKTSRLEVSQIVSQTHQTLERFDAVASLKYAASHGLIEKTTKSRRGRPRLKRQS